VSRIGKSRPVPWRPYRDGPPAFAPKLRPIPEAHWLHRDTEAAAWLAPKRALMRERRAEVFATAPGIEAAEAELAAHIGLRDAVAFDWPTALEAAASTVSDDLVLLTPAPDGRWCLRAASLCAPTFWRLAEGVGQTLNGLHGPVPGGDPGLAGRIGRVFDNLQPGTVLERFNWTVQAGGERFTPSQAPLKARAQAAVGQIAARQLLHLRVERQTIRKLPVSGAVVFSIRVAVDPLTDVLDTLAEVAAFRAAWAGLSEAERAYKGWPAYEHLVAAWG